MSEPLNITHFSEADTPLPLGEGPGERALEGPEDLALALDLPPAASQPEGQTATCPLCPAEVGLQPIDNFGIVRARQHLNGRNLYCKSCICKKVSESRVRLRDYRAQQKQQIAAAVESAAEVSLVRDAFVLRDHTRRLTQRILAAIQLGYHSYAKIERAVRVYGSESEDTFCDAIAHLLLETREIRHEGSGDDRHYFIRTTQTAVDGQRSSVGSSRRAA